MEVVTVKLSKYLNKCALNLASKMVVKDFNRVLRNFVRMDESFPHIQPDEKVIVSID